MDDVIARMRRDWDARAAENAKYYVACQKWIQSDAEFYSGAPEIIARVRRDYPFLAKDPSECRFLEIGCGLGRLMFSLAADCREIHGVDISPEMISAARASMASVPNARFAVAQNSDLTAYPDASFDLAYSYAVFQHIPERRLILRYLDEILRVLQPGGIFVGHFNGAPPFEDRCDTWVGSWVSGQELFQYARNRDWQVRCREGADSPYLWLTMRKPALPAAEAPPHPARIISVTHVCGGPELVSGGPLGFATLFVTGLPDEYCCLTGLTATVGGRSSPPCYIGPALQGGARQVNIQVPGETPVGEHEIVLEWRGRRIANSIRATVASQTAITPRLLAVTDGRDILVRNVVRCGVMQITLDGCRDPETLTIAIGGRAVEHSRPFCIDPLSRLHQVNLDVPPGISGKQVVTVSLDGQELPPAEIVIEPAEPRP